MEEDDRTTGPQAAAAGAAFAAAEVCHSSCQARWDQDQGRWGKAASSSVEHPERQAAYQQVDQLGGNQDYAATDLPAAP